jgi:hypothetical protein
MEDYEDKRVERQGYMIRQDFFFFCVGASVRAATIA